MNNIRGDEVRHGKYIYLAALSKSVMDAVSGEVLSENMLNWLHDGNSPLQPMTARQIVENYKEQGGMVFAVCLQANDTCIGACGLGDVVWKSRHAHLSVGIVEESHYTQELLGDVINTVLQFAYWEANLNRIGMKTAVDNTIMQSAVDQVGFTEEGRLRQEIYRNGNYLDMLVYSILEREWSA